MSAVEITSIIVGSLAALASSAAVVIREIRQMKVAVIEASREAHAETISALTGAHKAALESDPKAP